MESLFLMTTMTMMRIALVTPCQWDEQTRLTGPRVDGAVCRTFRAAAQMAPFSTVDRSDSL